MKTKVVCVLLFTLCLLAGCGSAEKEESSQAFTSWWEPPPSSTQSTLSAQSSAVQSSSSSSSSGGYQPDPWPARSYDTPEQAFAAFFDLFGDLHLNANPFLLDEYSQQSYYLVQLVGFTLLDQQPELWRWEDSWVTLPLEAMNTTAAELFGPSLGIDFTNYEMTQNGFVQINDYVGLGGYPYIREQPDSLRFNGEYFTMEAEHYIVYFQEPDGSMGYRGYYIEEQDGPVGRYLYTFRLLEQYTYCPFQLVSITAL